MRDEPNLSASAGQQKVGINEAAVEGGCDGYIAKYQYRNRYAKTLRAFHANLAHQNDMIFDRVARRGVRDSSHVVIQNVEHLKQLPCPRTELAETHDPAHLKHTVVCNAGRCRLEARQLHLGRQIGGDVSTHVLHEEEGHVRNIGVKRARANKTREPEV
jgi:hypothetical protein